jgi:hypothetical protein
MLCHSVGSGLVSYLLTVRQASLIQVPVEDSPVICVIRVIREIRGCSVVKVVVFTNETSSTK